jgi:DNA polymerase III epsilon subunit-like protein
LITLELQHIVTHAEIAFYPRGETIIRMGDSSGGHLNVIQTGCTRVSIKNNLFSLGAFRIKERRVWLGDRFETFVNPGKDIPPETIKLLGIVPDMVKDAPDTA